MKNIHTIFLTLLLSPQNKIPDITVPITPIPVYAAYATDASIVFMDKCKKYIDVDNEEM